MQFLIFCTGIYAKTLEKTHRTNLISWMSDNQGAASYTDTNLELFQVTQPPPVKEVSFHIIFQPLTLA